MMDFDIRLYSKRAAGYYPLADILKDATYTTNRAGSAGKLEITLQKTTGLAFWEGDLVTLRIGGVPIFWGYVFKKGKNQDGEMSVTCYDRLRYLKAKQSYIVEGTASGMVCRIAEDFRLPVNEIWDTGYALDPYVEEDKSLFDIIGGTLDKTLIATGHMYVLFDSFAGLCLKPVREMAVPYIIGDRSLATGFDYTTSIDDETYNYIKIVRPNEETGNADTFIYNDESTIGIWGMLQLYHKADKDQNDAQIHELGRQMLSYYNRSTESLSIDCIGIPGIIAGNTLPIELTELGDIPRLIIDKCTHEFSSGEHTMSLELITGGTRWS